MDNSAEIIETMELLADIIKKSTDTNHEELKAVRNELHEMNKHLSEIASFMRDRSVGRQIVR